MQTLLRFAGFQRQPFAGFLRGILYLEVCKLCSASSIELEITTFRKSLLYFFVLFELCSFFRRTENLFVSYVIGPYRSQSQHIATQASQKFNMFDFVASMQAFIAKAVIACDHWCPYIVCVHGLKSFTFIFSNYLLP